MLFVDHPTPPPPHPPIPGALLGWARIHQLFSGFSGVQNLIISVSSDNCKELSSPIARARVRDR
jgi:hypothetical protein